MYDLLVIGGGINGVGIARDAAGRGLKVLLCERDDFASHTSSASTKLIHGGLRYLEFYDFKLVRKALIEREILLRAAPHIIWPMRFVLPHAKDLRPAWLIRLGLFLYDHLGGRKLLPATKTLRRGGTTKLYPLREDFQLAFEYSDCWVEDSRLVVLNAVDAKERGADVRSQTAVTGLQRSDDGWTATLTDADGEDKIRARMIVNAAGGWVDDIIDLADPTDEQTHLRLVKGSHIIVRRWHEGEHAYFFQNGDGRIMFAIPYEQGEFTLIGTTDVPFEGDRSDVQISQEEIEYLCAGASEYYKRKIKPEDVVHTYSGVRPLYDDHAADASKVTRDYVLKLDKEKGAPILSVFGGKITTYRELAEDAMDDVLDTLGKSSDRWTEHAHLPGGDIPGAAFDEYCEGLVQQFAWLDESVVRRLARAYGTRVPLIIGNAKTVADLGVNFGGDLYEAEVRYLQETEFATTAEDILWRRSKLGLHLNAEDRERLSSFL
ncbi:MAG: glycerol-3-phosphate dehydrogenase [Hyphomonas sp.]